MLLRTQRKRPSTRSQPLPTEDTQPLADELQRGAGMWLRIDWISVLGRSRVCTRQKLRWNVLLFEDDRYRDLALDTSAYTFRDGPWSVPEIPGRGIELGLNHKEFSLWQRKSSSRSAISG